MQEILDTVLSFGGWSLFALAIIVGLLLDLLGLFGNWIILAAMVIAWIATGFEHFGWIGIGGMIAFAIIGEVLEFLAAGYGAKKFGGSKGSMPAALVGCIGGAILGSPIFPIVGTLIGACIGAFVGAALWEYIKHEKETGDALWTGLGAAVGKVAGLFVKTAAGFAMLLVAVFTY